jgi:hypothetical protein
LVCGESGVDHGSDRRTTDGGVTEYGAIAGRRILWGQAAAFRESLSMN